MAVYKWIYIYHKNITVNANGFSEYQTTVNAPVAMAGYSRRFTGLTSKVEVIITNYTISSNGKIVLHLYNFSNTTYTNVEVSAAVLYLKDSHQI